MRLVIATSILVLGILAFSVEAKEENTNEFLAGIVKVRTNSRSGSGIVIRIDQHAVYILTAAHVVAGDSAPQVKFFEQKMPAFRGNVEEGSELSDDERGLALLRIDRSDKLPAQIRALPLAVEHVEVVRGEDIAVLGLPREAGDWAILHGGMVTRRGRDLMFDAPIDEGVSGGAVLRNGQVIGLVQGRGSQFGRGNPADSLWAFVRGLGVQPEPGWHKESSSKGQKIVNNAADPGKGITHKMEKSPSGLSGETPSQSFKGSSTADELHLKKKEEFENTAKPILKDVQEERSQGLPRPKHMAKVPAPSMPRRLEREIVGKDGGVMVLIPDGGFTSGSPGNKDNPPRQLYIKNFYIDKFEVTVGQYHKFLEKMKPSTRTPADWDKINLTVHHKHPVAGVNYYDADAYCRWAGKRLPTHGQWEKAARGTDGRSYPWGNTPPDESMTNFNKNYCFFCNVYDEKISPVGTFEKDKSPFGVYDMAGNVSEWVQGGKRRGGDWRTGWPGAEDSMALMRIWDTGKTARNPGGNPDQGFRCAMDAPLRP